MIFREFQQGRMGFASALGVVIFALTLSVTLAPRLLRARSAIHGGE